MDTSLEPKTYTVRMRERGQLTIPQPVRDSLAAEQGETDIFTLVQIGDLLLLTPKKLRIPELSEEFSSIMEEEGVTLAELLEGLEREREAIWQERQANVSIDKGPLGGGN